MRHQVREEGAIVVVELRGDVDLESSPRARALLLEWLGRGRDLIVDLSGIHYMDSSGVASLVEAYQISKRQGSRFALAAVSPTALRVLQLARLDRVFTIHATLADGLDGGA